MQFILNIFLFIHIAAGYIAFIAAPVALITKKGGKKHKVFGLTFFYAMCIVSFTALMIAAAKQNAFLFHIGIFTFYMNYTGRRAITVKSLKASGFDLFLLGISALNGFLMIGSSQFVLVAFGILNSIFSIGDFLLYVRIKRGNKTHPLHWLFRHIGRMLGTYIAAITAFLVVNIHFNSFWIGWLLPGLIGTPLIFYFIYTVKRQAGTFQKLFLFLIFSFLVHQESLMAQPYISGGKTRHRFAQLTLGTDARIFSGHHTQSFFERPDGSIEQTRLKNYGETRLIIGGTHFWGHADFYIAIPFKSIGGSGFSSSAETGARYFPRRITHQKIRTFIGISQLPLVFKQGQGTSLLRFLYPISVGCVFNYKKHLFEFSMAYLFRNQHDYYITANTVAEVKTQSFYCGIAYKIMLETTAIGEHNWRNGKTQRYTDSLASKNKLNSLTFAIGPSSAFFLKTSSHNRDIAPYIGDHKSSHVFPDLGLGYYFHRTDLQINLAYRSYKHTLQAYDFIQTIQRRAITLEAYKFFADYHGFNPFMGLALSNEKLYVKEINPAGTISSEHFRGLKPGFSLGWDIRPSRILSWYLRTNLRYFPHMGVTMRDGKTVPFDVLEVNFIQLVILPGRFN